VRAYRSKSRAKRRLRADPGQGSFDDPAFGKTTNLCSSCRLDDLDHPMAGAGSGARDAWSLIAGIGEDALDEGEQQRVRRSRTKPRPVAVLNVGRMNDDVQQEAERIDQDVALCAR